MKSMMCELLGLAQVEGVFISWTEFKCETQTVQKTS